MNNGGKEQFYKRGSAAGERQSLCGGRNECMEYRLDGDKLSVLHMKVERKSDCVRSLRWMENGILIRNTDSETSLSLLPRSVMQSWL